MQLILLDDVAPSSGPSKGQRKRMKTGWEPINHACRHCGGRLIQRENADGSMSIRCPQCEAIATGGHDSLCCCGEEVAGLGRVWECFLNPNPSKANPQIVLVRERPVVRPVRAKDMRASNPVRVPEY